jgi:ABC-type glycerol-3-phosphate transport system permease component
MQQRSPLTQLFVYAALVIGAVLFTLPFVWMVGSSMKADRELFAEGIRFLPTTPLPRSASPFVDDRFFTDLPASAARQAQLLPGLEQMVDASGFVFPPTVHAETARREVARGVLRRLAGRVPPEIWNGPAPELLAFARGVVDAEMVRSIFGEVYRYLGLGTISVRTESLIEAEVSRDLKPTERWRTTTPETATLSDETRDGKLFARVDYDFSRGNRLVVESTPTLPFDVNELRRVDLAIRPDDTWHSFRLRLDANGRSYTSRRDGSIGNFEWFTARFQFASADDHSTKVRNWIILDDAGPSTAQLDPRQIRLTLEIEQSTPLRAWAHKMSANYTRTLEQIPFWRYVRVSVFLVIANVVLNVLFSSLVAYAFARITFPGRDFMFLLMLATMMIPAQVTMIPHFVIWKSAGLYDTLAPLWFGAVFANAFHVFLLRQFMKGIPRDLEDSARLDGCGFLRIYWHVILPLITPSLAAIAIFTFMGVWNNFFGPLLYIADQRLYPLAFGLYAFHVQVGGNPALSMAGSVLMTMPIIAIFFFAQRYFIQGVTLTGMKG